MPLHTNKRQAGFKDAVRLILLPLWWPLYTLFRMFDVYDRSFRFFMSLVERDAVPDWLIRLGIRFLLSKRARTALKSQDDLLRSKLAFVEELKNMPVAIHTASANEQHYEVPTEYFLLVLGKHLKYSSCLYLSPDDNLDMAELHMLALTCERAKLENGQDVLELGCGWGSLSLYMARMYPKSRITAVSNSKTQKELIMKKCREQGLSNLQVITADMVDFQAPSTYDRVVSVEMFEHMKNYRVLMKRIASWLKPGGLLFVHIFVHRSLPYHFEVEREDDWMSRYFFTGGTMPSLDLLLYFQEDLALKQHWYVKGTHYSKTLEAWLKLHDRHRAQIWSIFERTYGQEQTLKWFVYWRLFYLACSELFNYNGGNEWGVGHYLFEAKEK